MNSRSRHVHFSAWSFDHLNYMFLLLLVSTNVGLAQTVLIRYVKVGGAGNGSAWASRNLQVIINAS